MAQIWALALQTHFGKGAKNKEGSLAFSPSLPHFYLLTIPVLSPKPSGFPPFEQYLHSDRRMGRPERGRERGREKERQRRMNGLEAALLFLTKGALGHVDIYPVEDLFPKQKGKQGKMSTYWYVFTYMTDKTHKSVVPQSWLLLWNSGALCLLSATRWRPTKHRHRASSQSSISEFSKWFSTAKRTRPHTRWRFNKKKKTLRCLMTKHRLALSHHHVAIYKTIGKPFISNWGNSLGIQAILVFFAAVSRDTSNCPPVAQRLAVNSGQYNGLFSYLITKNWLFALTLQV